MLVETRQTCLLAVTGLLMASSATAQLWQTEIAKWQYGKTGAISLTFDDGSINQFRVAVPIMDGLRLPATFFIITGEIPGSQYHGTFVGRPPQNIIEETASIPTSKDNFFERASAIGFLGLQGTLPFHTQAGAIYDEGHDLAKACQVIDGAYAKVRQGAFPPAAERKDNGANRITWEEISVLAKRGHELASHTVTHPRLAALDDANLVYELEKSRQEILDHLGYKHTFSVECPYGTENERAVAFALERYQLARNHMPDPFVDDLDRASQADPATSHKEYVRWQRGPLTATPMSLMKSWVDTAAAHDNIWLVLVFHGVDGIGWQPRTGADLKEYFGYIQSKQDHVWVATFQDVAKYMRERVHAEVRTYRYGDAISVVLRDDLKDASYDLPLTLKTYVPASWPGALVRQGSRTQGLETIGDKMRGFVYYQAVPNAETITLTAMGRN
jgi:peptidoglycan/xylan/chitin deacetylase (PgdA/CDA1 family)